MVDDIAQQVSETFGLGAVVGGPQYVARGAMGEIWHVRTETGRFALKELFDWVDCEPLPFDVAVQHAAAATGIQLPRPVVANDEAIRTVAGRRFRAYEWVDLADEVTPPVDAKHARDVGGCLARIHRLDIDIPEGLSVDAWYRTPPSPARLDELHDEACRAAEPWADHLLARRDVIRELASLVEEPQGATAVCHRDFDPTNVIPARATGELVVLDWENVGPLAIDQELAATVHAWTTSTTTGTAHLAAARQLLDGYHHAGGPAILDGTRSFSMAVSTALNFTVVMAEQALDAQADDHHRDFGRRQLNDLLDRHLKNLLNAIPELAALA